MYIYIYVYMAVSKIRGPILVVPIIRTRIYLGLFWGPLFLEAPIYRQPWVNFY